MKKSTNRFVTLCLVAAAALSLMIGAGLPRIQAFSADVVSRLFPVSYQITYRSTETQPVAAPVRFLTDTAIVATPAGNRAVPISDAVFICLQNELRIQNALRSGLLAAFFVLMAACLPAGLAAAAFYNGVLKVQNGTRRRVHTVPRHPAACARRTPTMPSAA